MLETAMNAHRLQLRWPAAVLAATTLLGLALSLSILYQQRFGIVSGSLTRQGTSHAPWSSTGAGSAERSYSRDTYEVKLLPPRAGGSVDNREAATYGTDAVLRPLDPEETTQVGNVLGFERLAAKMPPEAVRRWLLPIRQSQRLP